MTKRCKIMEEQLSELTTYANALWVLVSAALVFFMHAGFALVESGFCRKKNAVMVLMKNFGVVAISSLVFYLVGYGVMFGETIIPDSPDDWSKTSPPLIPGMTMSRITKSMDSPSC